MRTVDVTQIPQYGAGVNGFYCRLTQRKGIKVLTNKIYNQFGVNGFDPRLPGYDSVKLEFVSMKLAEKSGITPKAHEIVFVRNNENIHLGIIMQHISGPTLAELVEEYKVDDAVAVKIEYRLINQLEKIGIYHNDLCSNWNNIIIQKKNGRMKAFAIDFGSVDYEG